MLTLVGEPDDIELLHRAARSSRQSEFSSLARSIARRLAKQVQVHDLGRVRIEIADRKLDGSQIRRKVLALLCLLITRPGFSASREHVIESLWPDQDPDDGLNSLNQTVYFLRRVFEPKFKDGSSPGYVQQDGETIWLDPELVHAQSSACRSTIARVGSRPSATDAIQVLSQYPAPFALDFAYEEWATRYREPLHTAVLRVVESGLAMAIQTGDLANAITVAEHAVLLEPESEELQLALVVLYRRTGAHAAAAEQYGQYVESMKALGLQPASTDEIDLARLWG